MAKWSATCWRERRVKCSGDGPAAAEKPRPLDAFPGEPAGRLLGGGGAFLPFSVTETVPVPSRRPHMTCSGH